MDQRVMMSLIAVAIIIVLSFVLMQPVAQPTNVSGDMGAMNDMDAQVGYVDISVQDAKTLIDNTPDLVIIDVSPNYDQGHIPGAVNYYVGDGSLDAAIPTLDKNKPYLVYCHVDSAAISGAEKLVNAGFMTVYRLEGNYAAWVAAGYEVET
jgi:rhodanese-related sulfurtransferase